MARPSHRTMFGMRTLVVLPTYNEADNIVEVLRQLRRQTSGLLHA